MAATRRWVLASIAAGLSSGCLGGAGGGGTPTTDAGGDGATPTDGSGPSPNPAECDPAEVTRPPLVEDANHSPKGYGTKPQELTQQSVADYLADFETAFAWNRILAEHSPVTNIGVDTTTPWTPAAAGTGFLASSRIETSYIPEGNDEPTERGYIANYFVSPNPVYRVETADDPVDPRSHPDRQLVHCGADSTK